MANTNVSRSIPIISVIAFLAASASWFYFEYYSVRGYLATDRYDWTIESLSDLAIEYKQVHPLKHHTVYSTRAKLQNFSFLLNGALFAIAQLSLLFSTSKAAGPNARFARNLRLLLSLLFVAGTALFANVHGGPREQKDGTIGWHWNGLALIAIAGNLNSIISGLVPDQVGPLDRNIIYRAVSIALGLAGLFSFYQFQTIGKWNFRSQLGLWQRGIVYSVQAWQALTAVGLVATSASSQTKVKAT